MSVDSCTQNTHRYTHTYNCGLVYTNTHRYIQLWAHVHRIDTDTQAHTDNTHTQVTVCFVVFKIGLDQVRNKQRETEKKENFLLYKLSPDLLLFFLI